MNSDQLEKLRQAIVFTENFPAPGILFRDLNPLWEQADLFQIMIHEMKSMIQTLNPTKIVALEARGFIIGSALAYSMDVGLALIRKKGKLPGKTFTANYKNEYTFMGDIQIQAGALSPDDRVLLIDDILATGKSTVCCIELLSNFPQTKLVGSAYILEIKDLEGRSTINADIPILSLIKG